MSNSRPTSDGQVLTAVTADKLWKTIQTLRTAVETAQASAEADRLAEVRKVDEALEKLRGELPQDVGGGGPGTWSAAPPDVAKTLSAELFKLRGTLIGLLDGDGPLHPPRHIMRFAYAPSWTILFLFLFGLAGSGLTLHRIIIDWPAAVGELARTPKFEHDRAPRPPSVPPSAAPLPSKAAPPDAPVPSGSATPAAADGGPSERGLGAAGESDAGAEREAESRGRGMAAGKSKPTRRTGSRDELEKEAGAEEAKPEEQKRVPEGQLMTMVILMGLLGGWLHLTSSMAKYVGSRKLLRSWIIYYLLMPVTGAGLAVVSCLLLRAGILGGSGEVPNPVGLYGIAALTGLFAEQAMEMLSDVFSRIFTKVKASDPIEEDGAKKKP